MTSSPGLLSAGLTMCGGTAAIVRGKQPVTAGVGDGEAWLDLVALGPLPPEALRADWPRNGDVTG